MVQKKAGSAYGERPRVRKAARGGGGTGGKTASLTESFWERRRREKFPASQKREDRLSGEGRIRGKGGKERPFPL